MSYVPAGPRLAGGLLGAWMAFWRTVLLSILLQSEILFGFAFLLAPTVFVVLIATGYTFTVFPLARLLVGHSPIHVSGKRVKSLSRVYSENQTKKRLGSPSYRPHSLQPESRAPKLKKASKPGLITGFEPRSLANLTVQKSPWIVGNPGFGLSQSDFAASSVKAGQAGERNFALALQKASLIDRYQSFWSCAMPSPHGMFPDAEYQTDIDCVLFDGKTVFLVDLKNYKGGDLTYYMRNGGLACRDNASGSEVECSTRLSKNMQMADERIRKHLRASGVRVESRVVFMPTDLGAGRIEGVRWPGNIRALYLSEFLEELSQGKGFQQVGSFQRISGLIGNLVKR